MLPSAITLSLERAEVENSVPCGRMNPRRLALASERAPEEAVEEDIMEARDWRSEQDLLGISTSSSSQKTMVCGETERMLIGGIFLRFWLSKRTVRVRVGVVMWFKGLRDVVSRVFRHRDDFRFIINSGVEVVVSGHVNTDVVWCAMWAGGGRSECKLAAVTGPTAKVIGHEQINFIH